MRPVAFALLFCLLPASLTAQTPSNQQQRSSGKKMKWLGIAAIAGGISAAALNATSRKETTVLSTSAANAMTASAATISTVVASIAPGVALGTGIAAPLPPGAITPQSPPGGGTTPLSPPSGGTASQIPTVTPSNPTSPLRINETSINWKVVGPAMGIAAAGTFLTYMGHVKIKKADLSVKPNGALQIAFKW